MLPLVTPLAEFVDFARRAGVGTNDTTKLSNIEIVHPRHTSSPVNFRPDGVQPGIIWSHDPVARTAATNLGKATTPTNLQVSAPHPTWAVIELSALEQLVSDPLRLFVKHTLGINTWRDNEASTPAIFPLALTTREHRDLAVSNCCRSCSSTDPNAEAEWQDACKSAGCFPSE